MRPGDVIADRYELSARAGAGGMGVVFRAIDRGLGAEVAIKVLVDPIRRRADRFVREGKVLAALDHPNVVRYLDRGVAPDGSPYIVMEWLDGHCLGSRIRAGRLAVDQTLHVGRQVAGALAAAHAQQVVHRDLKPANLWLVGERIDALKVLDFGLARRLDASSVLTSTGAVVGTPAYMAPEQARGGREIDPRADVFALGCVLYECLAGRPAFGGRHSIDIWSAVLFDDPPALERLRPEVPRALVAVIETMLQKEPELRYADGAAAGDALSTIDASATEIGTLTDAPRRGTIAPSDAQVVAVIAGPSSAAPFLAEAATGRGDRVEALAGGRVGLVSIDHGDRHAHAMRAARAALSLAAALPYTTFALAMGRGVAAGHSPIDSVVERAVELRAHGAGGVVCIDSITCGLLPERFVVGDHSGSYALLGERPDHDVVPDGAPHLVGRDAELDRLERLVVGACAGFVTRIVELSGASGIGKTRLSRELARRIRARGERVAVWSARGVPTQRDWPLALVAGLVRDGCGVGPDDARELRAVKVRARVARQLPRDRVDGVVLALAPLAGAIEADADPIERFDARVRALATLLEAECALGPMLLLVDDVDSADAPSLSLLARALRRVPALPLCVLVSGASTRRWPARIDAEARVGLGPLPIEPARRLVAEVSRRHGAGGEVEPVVAIARGRPLLLTELARAGAPTPEDLAQAYRRRLEALSPSEREAIDAAAVLGSPAPRAGIAHLLGRRPPAPRDDASGLLRDLGGAGGGLVEASHPRLFGQLRGELPDPELARLSARLAAFLSERLGVPPCGLSAPLETARDPAAASSLAAAAVEHAAAGCEDDARRLAERAREQGGRAPDVEAIIESRRGLDAVVD